MENDLNISADNLLLLKNFLHEYSLADSERIIGLIYESLDDPLKNTNEDNREQIMSFVESLEEVIHALHSSNLISVRNKN